jgi:tRNA threonylcarbamoyladenosine biosynthesis protein TsaE
LVLIETQMPIPPADEMYLSSSLMTQHLARCLGKEAFPGCTILLQGELGSGKTTFVQGLAQGLGILDPVTSPTFILQQEYEEGRIPMIHGDLYRLKPEETSQLGWEYWDHPRGVIVIEWPERLSQWPSEWLHLKLGIQGEQVRHLRVTWQGRKHQTFWQTSKKKFLEDECESTV